MHPSLKIQTPWSRAPCPVPYNPSLTPKLYAGGSVKYKALDKTIQLLRAGAICGSPWRRKAIEYIRTAGIYGRTLCRTSRSHVEWEADGPNPRDAKCALAGGSLDPDYLTKLLAFQWRIPLRGWRNSVPGEGWVDKPSFRSPLEHVGESRNKQKPANCPRRKGVPGPAPRRRWRCRCA